MRRYIISSLLLLITLTGLGFAVKLSDLPGVMKPVYVHAEGDDLFIVEQTDYTVHVYSLTDFKLKYKVGKRGEGPGEFKIMPKIREITKDRVMINAGDKTLWYSRDGKLLREEPIKFRRMTPVKNNYVAQLNELNVQNRTIVKAIYLLNSKFEIIKLLCKIPADASMYTRHDQGDEEVKMLMNYIGFWCHDGKIFIGDSRKGFYFDVYDSEGNYLYAIDKKIEKVKVGNEYKRKSLEDYRIRYKALYERRRKNSFTFYEYFPAIRDFVMDDGKLYVSTYKEKDDKHEIIVLDPKGNILARIFVPFKSQRDYKLFGATDPYAIHKGILYELIDNEETETMELHKTDLRPFLK